MRGRHPGLSGASLLNYFAFGLPGIDGLPGFATGLAAGFVDGLTDCDFIAFAFACGTSLVSLNRRGTLAPTKNKIRLSRVFFNETRSEIFVTSPEYFIPACVEAAQAYEDDFAGQATYMLTSRSGARP
jgi:hypothetical protein